MTTQQITPAPFAITLKSSHNLKTKTHKNELSFPSKQGRFLSTELGEKDLSAERLAQKRQIQNSCVKGGPSQLSHFDFSLPGHYAGESYSAILIR